HTRFSRDWSSDVCSSDLVRWQKILGEFDDFPLTPQKELMIAPGFPYKESHRHLSHLMAIHPLGLIKWEDGELAQAIIKNSLAQRSEERRVGKECRARVQP